MKDKLPLPSVCAVCRTTIHAAHARSEEHGSSSRRLVVVWHHDAPLATIVRRGGAHAAAPDPTFAPQRARIVGPAFESVVEATRGWHLNDPGARSMPLAA